MNYDLTNAQCLILEVAMQKEAQNNIFQDLWSEYNESYDDYNDCHGDYYDAE